MILIFQWLAFAGFSVATILAFVSILLKRRVVLASAPAFAAFGFVCQFAVFTQEVTRQPDLAFWSLNQVLSFLSLVAVLIYLFGVWRYRLHVLGVVMLPLALVLHLFSGWVPAHALPMSQELRDPLMWLHIVTSTLGKALGGMAATPISVARGRQKATSSGKSSWTGPWLSAKGVE